MRAPGTKPPQPRVVNTLVKKEMQRLRAIAARARRQGWTVDWVEPVITGNPWFSVGVEAGIRFEFYFGGYDTTVTAASASPTELRARAAVAAEALKTLLG